MTLGHDNGTDGQTDGQTDRQTDRVRRNMRPPAREEGRITMYVAVTVSFHNQFCCDDKDTENCLKTVLRLNITAISQLSGG